MTYRPEGMNLRIARCGKRVSRLLLCSGPVRSGPLFMFRDRVYAAQEVSSMDCHYMSPGRSVRVHRRSTVSLPHFLHCPPVRRNTRGRDVWRRQPWRRNGSGFPSGQPSGSGRVEMVRRVSAQVITHVGVLGSGPARRCSKGAAESSVSPAQLELVLDADARAFPPRLPAQPIFYPGDERGLRRADRQRVKTLPILARPACRLACATVRRTVVPGGTR